MLVPKKNRQAVYSALFKGASFALFSHCTHAPVSLFERVMWRLAEWSRVLPACGAYQCAVRALIVVVFLALASRQAGRGMACLILGARFDCLHYATSRPGRYPSR